MARANIMKAINMGHKDGSDVAQFVSEEFILIDEKGIVWIKPIVDVEVRFPDNGCLELVFNEDNAVDVMFDTDKEEEEHICLFRDSHE